MQNGTGTYRSIFNNQPYNTYLIITGCSQHHTCQASNTVHGKDPGKVQSIQYMARTLARSSQYSTWQGPWQSPVNIIPARHPIQYMARTLARSSQYSTWQGPWQGPVNTVHGKDPGKVQSIQYMARTLARSSRIVKKRNVTDYTALALGYNF